MRGKRLAILFAASLTVVLPIGAGTSLLMLPDAAPAYALADFDPDHIIADRTLALTQALTAPGAEQPVRLDAARKLLAIGHAEQRAALRAVLTDPDPANPPARLAVLQALSEDTLADPQFINPLFALFDDPNSPRVLLNAAADVLGLYKSSPEVATRLLSLTDAGRNDNVRLAGIRALGSLADKRVAGRLVQLSTDASPAITTAALESLGDFASLKLDSPLEWQQWWTSEQGKSDAQFRDDLLSTRVARLEQRRRELDDVAIELDRRIVDQFNRLPREEQAGVLLGFLSSPREAVRIAAAKLCYDRARTNELPAAAAARMPALLDDPSPQVRIFAARTLQLLNDPAAFDGIGRQLAVERDSLVKLELIKALEGQQNPAAVGLLRRFFDDTSPRVVNAAIRAITVLAPAITQSDPNVARDLSFHLQRIVDTRTRPGDGSTRAFAVLAMAQLAQREQLQLFSEMLVRRDPAVRESVDVRRAAAIGIGNLGDERAADILVEALRDDSPAVRLAVVQAIGNVSRSGDRADALLALCDPAREKDEGVRGEAWKTLTRLFRYMAPDTLSRWAERPVIAGDPSRKLDVYQALLAKAEQARNVEDQGFRLQQIGDVLLDLNRPADAVAAFSQALQLARSSNAPGVRIIRLVQSELKARLLTGDYKGAVAFASEILAGSKEVYGDVMLVMKDHLRDLQKDGKLDEAARLVDELLQMNPPLAGTYLPWIQELQQDLRDRRGQQNEVTRPGPVRPGNVAHAG